jgi:squalene-hopene/tetraprenyl-beta-curcumene cyclase
MMGLLASGSWREPAVQQGVRFLLDRQRSDGTWDEPQFTGTGFPQVFYLRYHFYPLYFPLQALGRYLAAARSGRRASAQQSPGS